MPDKIDRCVAKVQKKIDAGELPLGSNPWAICKASIKENPGNESSEFRKIWPVMVIGTAIISGYCLLVRIFALKE